MVHAASSKHAGYIEQISRKYKHPKSHSINKLKQDTVKSKSSVYVVDMLIFWYCLSISLIYRILLCLFQ